MYHIKKGSLSKIKLSDIFSYKSFIYNVFYRNITVIFKQTAFGYFWRIIIPIIQSGLIAIVFSGIANLPTDEVPPFLFYYSGMVAWILFQSSVVKVSDIFFNYSHFMRNIYVPKICFPIAVILENIYFFAINVSAFFLIYFYFSFSGHQINFNFPLVIFCPFVIVYTSIVGMIIGLFTALLSAKFRDLRFIVQNGMQIFFYGTPIVYSLNSIPEKFHFIFFLNPVVFSIDYFRNLFFSVSNTSLLFLFSSFIITLIFLIITYIIFIKTSGNLVDNV